MFAQLAVMPWLMTSSNRQRGMTWYDYPTAGPVCQLINGRGVGKAIELFSFCIFPTESPSSVSLAFVKQSKKLAKFSAQTVQAWKNLRVKDTSTRRKSQKSGGAGAGAASTGKAKNFIPKRDLFDDLSNSCPSLFTRPSATPSQLPRPLPLPLSLQSPFPAPPPDRQTERQTDGPGMT